MQSLNFRRAGAHGTAMIVAVLALFVITGLGLYVMLIASIEGDIAVNYRWGEMAFLNAEAGLEYAKNVLAGESFSQGDLRRLLPPARSASDMQERPSDPQACSDPASPGCRDYQFQIEYGDATIFIGRVLPRPDGSLVQFDFRQPGTGPPPGDINGDLVPDIQGTVTVWLRRPLLGGNDDVRNDRAVITAEGTAPNFESPVAGRPGALRRLEVMVRAVAGVEGVENAMSTNNSGTGANASDGVPAGQLTGSVK